MYRSIDDIILDGKSLRDILAAHGEWWSHPEPALDEPQLREALAELERRLSAGFQRSRADLRGADLNFADLRRLDLSRADLAGANLMRADFRGADLREADLGEADLFVADLSGANLRGASLVAADLTNANLKGADLRGTDLRRTTLDGTDFTGAVVAWTNFAHSRLGQAFGLESVRHEGPSTVGIDTVCAAAGAIPGEFLRGCGLPNAFIQHIPLIVHADRVRPGCFIRYSRADAPFAERLHDALQGRGVRCWLATGENETAPGGDEAIRMAARNRHKVILCLSRHSAAARWLVNDVAMVLAVEQRIREKSGHPLPLVLPIALDDAWTNGAGEPLATVKERLAADFSSSGGESASFEEPFVRLLSALSEPGEEHPPAE